MYLTTVIFTDMKPTEPSYLTNRAASYMASKRFRLALSDCQQATTLQSAEPSSKTLLRLARCQLALGLSEPALTTLRSVLALEPANTAAVQLNHKVLELEAHLRSFEAARKRSDWGMARLALDKCLQSIEAEGGEVPSQWRLWRVELELSRGNWDSANTAAK
jgi:DnaJ family protein C protein 7